MTIPDSLTAIAKARPNLVSRTNGVFHIRIPGSFDADVARFFFLGERAEPDTKFCALLLLWAFETAAREGKTLSLTVWPGAGPFEAVSADAGTNHDGPCPTAAVMAALADALRASGRVAT